jgi:magnesium-transporting ATPase (P-type)
VGLLRPQSQLQQQQQQSPGVGGGSGDPREGASSGTFGISLQDLQRLLSAAADGRRSAFPPLPPPLLGACAPPSVAPADAAAARAAALATALRSSPRRGLPEADPADHAARAAAFGTNRLPDAATSSLWQLLLEAASDATMLMLMAAGALSLGLSAMTHAEAADYIDGGECIRGGAGEG